LLDARVVATGDARCADLPRGDQQLIELHVVVARGARNRRTAGEIVLYKGAHHGLFKSTLEIDDVMGNANMLRNSAGVIDIVERTATLRRGFARSEFRKSALIPELHGQPDHRSARFVQHRRHS